MIRQALLATTFLLVVSLGPAVAQKAEVDFSNTEQADHSATDGLLYYDKNYYPDFPELSGDGGGLTVYTNGQWGAVLSTENTPYMQAKFRGLQAQRRLFLHNKKRFGGEYPTDNGNTANAFLLGGAGEETFQLFRQNSGDKSTFCGGNSYNDCYIFLQTDHNGNNPDGAVLFGGVGKDDVFEPHLMIDGGGKIGVGTTHPHERLSVAGNVLTEEVIVKPQDQWADFVFENGYNLPTLEEVSSFIGRKNHLPGVPSAESVRKNGLHLGEMDATLLQKVEELTLYAIEQKQRADSLSTRTDTLRQEVRQLQTQLRSERRARREAFEALRQDVRQLKQQNGPER